MEINFDNLRRLNSEKVISKNQKSIDENFLPCGSMNICHKKKKQNLYTRNLSNFQGFDLKCQNV